MFTMDNTDGFTQDELDELNEALKALVGDAMSNNDDHRRRADLEKSYSDALNNAWRPGMTADQLIKAVRR